MDTRKGYANRIQAYYDRSDEKPEAQKCLREMLKNFRFPSALDIGAGPGELTKVIHDFSDELTIIEVEREFSQILRKKLPKSEIFNGLLSDFKWNKKFDLILLAHVLYYFPEDEWMKICEKLLENLASNGSLILIQNVDGGDWWKTISHFKPQLGSECAFYYRKWPEFKNELAQIATIKSSMPYSYKVSYENLDDLVDYVGGSCLAITNQSVRDQIKPEVRKFCENHLHATDQGGFLTYTSEILMLQSK